MASAASSQHYQALVDIGSNGIRFSISDLSPPMTRITPTLYQSRCAISLYDAQNATGTKTPIPPIVIGEVLAVLLQFKRTCQDFEVQNGNIRLVATEATRNAINRDDLLRQVGETTGWKVELLTKEEEGRLGAMGIASSIGHIEGICMDMGGGSVQMTWVVKRPDGDVDMSPVGSVSFPYGAAALMSALSEISVRKEASLQDEMASKFRRGLEDIQIPPGLRDEALRKGGYTLYLSGGGFRGRGYILMSNEDIQPYPIPIINCYTVGAPRFLSNLEESPASASAFRVSSRRASQAPAVQLVIKALAQAEIPISKVVFTQGGVREGLLYSGLPPSIRSQSPLVASTLPHAPKSASSLTNLLRDAVPGMIETELLASTINLLYFHGSMPKDIRAAAALRSTTTGVLAGAHGLSHQDRGLLALVLCERWGADLNEADVPIYDSLQILIGHLAWWTKYVGRVAEGIANLFPAGVVREDEQTIVVESGVTSVKDMQHCWLKISVLRQDLAGTVREWAEDLRKLGKKKYWGKQGSGMKVNVNVLT
ncbi:MAG: hypothetical protein ALECFALPRED_000935 [Alectoria fallacina]|uniref:Uncharacterized protein n=1 Tax=Alectoria fallacina TaxID=1903189 RepID=A0A8H3F787_9LECA|nr:MAG: hypothetical protein ALECFALPRED_000935 [Alectoria fallacina]